jgi:hypothetical protein
MNLATILLMMIWVSFVVFLMGAWAIKSTFEQIKDIDMTDDDIQNIL